MFPVRRQATGYDGDMTARIADILATLNNAAPFTLAESWDNVGLLIGTPAQPAHSILVALDPTNALLDEAIALGADTIVTHHPVIFKPLSAIDPAESQGRLLARALAHGIALIACHTNLDSTLNGVSDILALELGLSDIVPLAPAADAPAGTGIGRIGRYQTPEPIDRFLFRLATLLDLDRVQVAGLLPAAVGRVAVCGGSGSELAPLALRLGADIYLSAEIKHNIAVWAVENSFCIIDGSHYATEKPAVALLVDTLRQAAAISGWQTTILPSSTERHPFASLEINQQR